jgi:hypothetical protein
MGAKPRVMRKPAAIRKSDWRARQLADGTGNSIGGGICTGIKKYGHSIFTAAGTYRHPTLPLMRHLLRQPSSLQANTQVVISPQPISGRNPDETGFDHVDNHLQVTRESNLIIWPY